MSGVKSAEQTERMKIEVSQEQADQLETLFELAKALASPTRLAIVGALAARLKQSLSIEELAEQTGLAAARMERDLRQLSEAGIIQIEEWEASKPGREPVPARVVFNQDYLKLMPQLITTLNQLNQQIRPAEKHPVLDERAQTIARFIKDGRLVGFPAQYKRQLCILEEVAKAFEPGVNYTEREVDAILKNIYEYDHCTLRRYLVDHRFLQRAEGIYRKTSPQQ